MKMGKKIFAVFIMLTMILSIGGFAAAATTATYHGYDKSKSIGTAGVQNWKYNNKDPTKGMCVDAFHHISAKTQPVTKGTSKVKNNNYIKLLIIQNYKITMTPQQGKNLQYAVWCFSDGIKPINGNVASMIKKAKSTKIKIPDCYNQLLCTQTTTSTSTSQPCITLFSTSTSQPCVTLIGNSTTTPCIKQTGSSCSSSSVLNYLYNCTSSVCKCGYKITTTIMHYDNVTTTITTKTFSKDSVSTLTYKNQSITTNVYANTTKTTTTKDTTNKYNSWCFNSITGKKTQKIILFTVKPKTVKTSTSNTIPTTTYFNTTTPNCNTYTTTQCNHSTYQTQCKSTTHKCVTKTIVTKTKICPPKVFENCVES